MELHSRCLEPCPAPAGPCPAAPQLRVECKPWKIELPTRKLELELTTVSSAYHVEMNPSDVGGSHDRCDPCYFSLDPFSLFGAVLKCCVAWKYGAQPPRLHWLVPGSSSRQQPRATPPPPPTHTHTPPPPHHTTPHHTTPHHTTPHRPPPPHTPYPTPPTPPHPKHRHHTTTLSHCPTFAATWWARLSRRWLVTGRLVLTGSAPSRRGGGGPRRRPPARSCCWLAPQASQPRRLPHHARCRCLC